MKYYIYISDTKVDMLYPQIPPPLLKKIASSLSIDIKVFGSGITVSAKGNQTELTRYSKVQIVSEYIEKYLDVGSIDAPSTYFKGKLPMRYTIFTKSRNQVVYFGGTTAHRIVGLGGSPEHLIGNKPSVSQGPTMPSSTLANIGHALHKLYYQEEDSQLRQDGSTNETYLNQEDSVLKAAAIVTTENLATRELIASTQRLEFLAKTLKQGAIEFDIVTRTPEGPKLLESPYVIIGTPIYVAIDD